MEENKICRNIRKYIYQVLLEDDDILFSKRSMNSLGKYLFDKIRKKIKYATNRLIKKEILRHSGKSFIGNYFTELINQVGIKELPRTALGIVNKKYVEVEQQYKNYLLKVNKKLNSIKQEQDTINLSDNKIKGKMGKLPINKDLTSEYWQLYNNFEQREKLRTYEEIIKFDRQYLIDCWKKEFEYESNIISILQKKAKSIYMGYDNILFESLVYHIQAAESNLKHELIIFYKTKFIPLYEKVMSKNMSKHILQELQREDYDIKEELKTIPLIDDLIDKKNNNKDSYLITLEKLFNDFSILSELNNAIDIIISNGKRKELLIECLSLFASQKYNLLINILPIQIEGIFYDLLVDSTTYQLFTNLNIYEKPTLREKLDTFQENKHIDIYEYFKYYFNNLIRNVTAHGRLNSNNIIENEDRNIKIIAYELMLDLNCLMYYYTQKSELVRMKMLLGGFRHNVENDDSSNYENMNFYAMFTTLSRQRHISILSFGVERFEPMQSIYWIFNPTYEKKYCSIYDKEDLQIARDIIYDNKFWEYVNGKLLQCIEAGRDYEQIDSTFNNLLNVILGLIEEGTLKDSIIKVKKSYNTLKKVNSEFNKKMNSIE